MIILSIVTYYFIFFFVFKILSFIEKSFIVPNLQKTEKIIEEKSYYFFKYGRNVIFLAASIEASKFNINNFNFIFFFIFLLGYSLRISSIITLSNFWSFKVEKKINHKIISHGIYNYFRHPAYIGNIYIPSFFLAIGLYYTGLLSILFVMIFYFLRTSTEDILIDELQNKN